MGLGSQSRLERASRLIRANFLLSYKCSRWNSFNWVGQSSQIFGPMVVTQESHVECEYKNEIELANNHTYNHQIRTRRTPKDLSGSILLPTSTDQRKKPISFPGFKDGTRVHIFVANTKLWNSSWPTLGLSLANHQWTLPAKRKWKTKTQHLKGGCRWTAQILMPTHY